MKKDIEKKPAEPLRFVETPTAKTIHDVLEYAALFSDIAVIYGGAGIGKTSALNKYAEGKPDCWMVTASPATASVAAALEEVAVGIGLKAFSGRASRLQREIIRKLKETKGMLMIDETQHLLISTLESLRSIHDATEVSLILCGNESVYARLTAGSTRAAQFAQLFSRIGKKLHVAGNLPGDAAAVVKNLGVNGEREITFVEKKIASTPGGLRSVVKTLRLASVLAYRDGGEITLKHLKGAWENISR